MKTQENLISKKNVLVMEAVMDQQVLRKLWREYHSKADRVFRAWEAAGFEGTPPTPSPMPMELRNLTCGAKTRAGTPCKMKNLYTNGRCRLHGGLSTGPTTIEGKAKAAQNGFKSRWNNTDSMKGRE